MLVRYGTVRHGTYSVALEVQSGHQCVFQNCYLGLLARNRKEQYRRDETRQVVERREERRREKNNTEEMRLDKWWRGEKRGGETRTIQKR